jgi:predicted secreted protein
MTSDVEAPQVVAVGKPFEVRLRAYPGSGALWHFITEPGTARLLERRTEPSASIGGEAAQVFVFDPDVGGRLDLRFVLRRPWEAEVRREITVTIRAE